MYGRLILEEFISEFISIQDKNNDDDDTNVASDRSASNMKYMAAHFGINEDYLENTNHLCTLNF